MTVSHLCYYYLTSTTVQRERLYFSGLNQTEHSFCIFFLLFSPAGSVLRAAHGPCMPHIFRHLEHLAFLQEHSECFRLIKCQYRADKRFDVIVTFFPTHQSIIFSLELTVFQAKLLEQLVVLPCEFPQISIWEQAVTLNQSSNSFLQMFILEVANYLITNF